DRFAGSLQEFYRAASKSRMLFTDSNELLDPAQQRIVCTSLNVNIDYSIAIHWIKDNRRNQLFLCSLRESGVSLSIPLHRGAQTMPILKPNVIAHSDLVSVIQHGAPRQGEDEAM